MPKYRNALPQLGAKTFLTDGGLETTLVFHDGYDLPEFAAYVLLEHDAGIQRLNDYFRTYATIAKESGWGFVLETPTWRTSKGWGEKIGHTAAKLDALNRKAVKLLEDIRTAFETPDCPHVISGQIGSAGDGYTPDNMLSPDQAEAYHAAQIQTFADTEADLVSAFTIPYAEEAIGIVRAAKKAGIPAVISFTVETDGTLPSGQPLQDAIEQVDAETANGAAYFMINCAHPTHFANVLEPGTQWAKRIGAVRANASKMSHAELDNAEALDEGNPQEFGAENVALKEKLPNLTVFGGCCGTDDRHIAEIAKAWGR
jgi:S-methylmethionine-dependent homocysteine/selenocysteine methylase